MTIINQGIGFYYGSRHGKTRRQIEEIDCSIKSMDETPVLYDDNWTITVHNKAFECIKKTWNE